MPLPDRLQKGFTYADGDVVNAAGLNALVDQATALSGFVSELDAASAATTDQVLLLKGGVLKRALVSTLQATGGVDTVNFNANPGSIFSDTVVPPTGTGAVTITLNMEEQEPRRVLAGPISGANAVPSFRLLRPSDLPTDPVTEIPVWTVDWSAGSVFTKTLPADTNTNHFLHSNVTDGQTIRIRILQAAGTIHHRLTWPDILWPLGFGPPGFGVTQVSGARDIVTLTRIGGFMYGVINKDFTTTP